MRDPRAVWEGCADDERWIDDPAAVVAEIQAEAFAAGRLAGVEESARCIERERDRLPQCWWTIGRALPRVVRALVAPPEPEPEPDPAPSIDEEAACDSGS